MFTINIIIKVIKIYILPPFYLCKIIHIKHLPRCIGNIGLQCVSYFLCPYGVSVFAVCGDLHAARLDIG